MKKGKICLRSTQWMKMSLGLSGCSEENTLQPKREKGGARMPHQQVRAKAFCFVSPRDGIERYTFLCGFYSPSLVYAPPADLIMSMPPETRYNNFSPLQWHFWWKQHWADPGSSSRFLELAAAPVPPWTLQIRICYPKRRKWQYAQGGHGAVPIATGEKRQAQRRPNKVFIRCFLRSYFSFFFLGEGCLH